MSGSPAGETPPASRPDRRQASNGPPIWPRFVWAATVLALSAGFLLGGSLFVVQAAGSGGSEWQAAAAQAHGHVQIFGWGGLMALGIGLHFLPRLLSAPLTHERWPAYILVLMTSGLVLRVIAQPILSAQLPGGVLVPVAGAFVLAATFELAAASLAAILVVHMFASVRIRTKQVPSLGVRLLILTAFASLTAALAINWIASLIMAAREEGFVSFRADGAVVLLGMTGFLTALSLAMSARLFPLYVQTPLPREAWLRAGVVVLIVGLTAQLVGITTQGATTTGAGQILVAVAFVCGVVALRVFEPRRPLPRRRVRVFTDPLQLHVVTAYVWLLFAGGFSLIQGAGNMGVHIASVSIDAERHALGAGFITVLILGVGSEMLPGLGRARQRHPRWRWLTLILANGAAGARVAPLLDHGLPGAGSAWLLSTAGWLGAAAIVVFLLNVPLTIRAKSVRAPAEIDPV